MCCHVIPDCRTARSSAASSASMSERTFGISVRAAIRSVSSTSASSNSGKSPPAARPATILVAPYGSRVSGCAWRARNFVVCPWRSAMCYRPAYSRRARS